MHALLHKYSIIYPKIIKQMIKSPIGEKKRKYKNSGGPANNVLKNLTQGSLRTKKDIRDNKNKIFKA